ncbi:response regulator receiver protein [Microbulbifer sp. TYP-18]|uniref:response regulator receiver protein n=1 Tax=Microbulbifer sp. TYP-18 TaxID=3230024 RepID=UPI0034C60956
MMGKYKKMSKVKIVGINMKKLIFIVSGLLLSSICYADFHWHTSKIKAVYPLNDGQVIFQFESESPDCPSPGSPHYYYLSVGQSSVTQEGADKMYSAALAAAMANKQVRIYFDDSSQNCFINRLFIDI